MKVRDEMLDRIITDPETSEFTRSVYSELRSARKALNSIITGTEHKGSRIYAIDLDLIEAHQKEFPKEE